MIGRIIGLAENFFQLRADKQQFDMQQICQDCVEQESIVAIRSLGKHAGTDFRTEVVHGIRLRQSGDCLPHCSNGEAQGSLLQPLGDPEKIRSS